MAYSNEPLTDGEKDLLRECICGGNRFGIRVVTPKLLKETADKTPAQVREMIETWKTGQKKIIDDQVAALLNKKEALK